MCCKLCDLPFVKERVEISFNVGHVFPHASLPDVL